MSTLKQNSKQHIQQKLVDFFLHSPSSKIVRQNLTNSQANCFWNIIRTGWRSPICYLRLTCKVLAIMLCYITWNNAMANILSETQIAKLIPSTCACIFQKQLACKFVKCCHLASAHTASTRQMLLHMQPTSNSVTRLWDNSSRGMLALLWSFWHNQCEQPTDISIIHITVSCTATYADELYKTVGKKKSVTNNRLHCNNHNHNSLNYKYAINVIFKKNNKGHGTTSTTTYLLCQ